MAVYASNASEYRAGCAIEVGTTSCHSDTPGTLAAGDVVSIIVGETGEAGGNVSVDWWFVFQPDG